MQDPERVSVAVALCRTMGFDEDSCIYSACTDTTNTSSLSLSQKLSVHSKGLLALMTTSHTVGTTVSLALYPQYNTIDPVQASVELHATFSQTIADAVSSSAFATTFKGAAADNHGFTNSSLPTVDSVSTGSIVVVFPPSTLPTIMPTKVPDIPPNNDVLIISLSVTMVCLFIIVVCLVLMFYFDRMERNEEKKVYVLDQGLMGLSLDNLIANDELQLPYAPEDSEEDVVPSPTNRWKGAAFYNENSKPYNIADIIHTHASSAGSKVSRSGGIRIAIDDLTSYSEKKGEPTDDYIV